MQREYKYPVFGTQGGGLVREVAPNHYIFVEKPDCPGLDVGDDMPEQWGIAAANNAAVRMIDEEQSSNNDEMSLIDLELAMLIEANKRR